MGGVYPQAGGGGDDEGADVQGGTRLGGHPTGLQPDQLLNGGQGVLLRQRGDAHAPAGGIDAPDVLHGAEELHPAVGGAVGLHALKNLLGVVEHHGGGLQSNGAIGDDAPIVPALALGVVHDKHMVGEGAPKHQGIRVRLGLPGGAGLNRIFFHGDSLLAG